MRFVYIMYFFFQFNRVFTDEAEMFKRIYSTEYLHFILFVLMYLFVFWSIRLVYFVILFQQNVTVYKK